ncbi:MAG: GTPase [Planctomycetes bacterium]|nr:GTPase [Planctomycetota bacterium]
MTKNVLIMGAAGKDFHLFNMLYRNNPQIHVTTFTATQIPHIDDRRYPPELAGNLYPQGIPIKPEKMLTDLIKQDKVEEVVFAYSDVSYNYIDVQRKKVEQAGAVFTLPKTEGLMVKSTKPIVAVCAVRTGAGKSPVSRCVVKILKSMGKKVAVCRHPMPYGNLVEQTVQRYETVADLDKHKCTIEEREDYEPHIRNGIIVFAGVDYEKVLRAAEKEADVVIWDGGNNDIPFFKPNIYITVADPLRAGHELSYYPGRVNFELADVIIINKVDSAKPEEIASVEANARKYNPKAKIVKANSIIYVPDQEQVKGKRVLVIEDGPTVTHGEMGYGAGYLAAKKYGAKEIIDPRPYAKGEIKDTFEKYKQTSSVLPAIGYTPKQMKDMEDSINAVPCDLVLMATPTDLGRYLKLNKPYLFVSYETEEIGKPNLTDILSPLK